MALTGAARRGAAWAALCVLAVTALAACSAVGSRGLGEPLGLDLTAADTIEVRRVVATPDVDDDHPPEERFDTPFGEYSLLTGSADAADLPELVDAVESAVYVDQGNVVYDLANPDYEVVFLGGGAEVGRLGYYLIEGLWGEYGVPGRWMDTEWQLIALTDALPVEFLG